MASFLRHTRLVGLVMRLWLRYVVVHVLQHDAIWRNGAGHVLELDPEIVASSIGLGKI